MAEVYSWPEVRLYAYTGTATTSALVGYGQDVTLALQWGYDNFQTLTGTWADTLTGQRADLLVGTLWIASNSALHRMTGTAVHWVLRASAPAAGPTAGYLLWSGRIDTLTLAGRSGDLYSERLSYHCNAWSAYP
jgi:hypothetical protein